MQIYSYGHRKTIIQKLESIQFVQTVTAATNRKQSIDSTNIIYPTDIVKLHYLDSGKQGDVYLATYLGKKVVLKELKQQSDELEIMKRLRHPNLILYIGQQADSNSIILEYMENGNLFDLLYHDKVVFTDHDIIDIFQQLIKGLKYLHHQNVVHNDLKITNILVNKQKVVKISDFGLATEICHNVAKDIRGLANIIYELKWKKQMVDNDISRINKDGVIGQLVINIMEAQSIDQITL